MKDLSQILAELANHGSWEGYGLLHYAIEEAIKTQPMPSSMDRLCRELVDVCGKQNPETIYRSIQKTHRAAIVEESGKTAGIGAELAARFQEEQYDELDGPVVRIAALDVPMPYNIPMEKHAIPDVERICDSVRAMMK